MSKEDKLIWPTRPQPKRRSKQIYDKPMVQIHHQMSVEKYNAIQADAEAAGMTMPQLMRRIIDMYLFGQLS